MIIKYKEKDKYLELENISIASLGELCNTAISKKEQNIVSELKIMIRKLFYFEQNIKINIKKVLIKKNSSIGQFILTYTDNEKIINTDNYITFEKITNAMKISIMMDESKIFNKLEPLFKKQFSGTKEYILENIRNGEQIVDFINKNDDFVEYLNKINGIKPQWIEYEMGEFYLNEVNSKIL